jgi:hypothetical protein
MSSSNGSVTILSSRSRAWIGPMLALLCSGCPDPQGRFDDYTRRVIDAGVTTPVDGGPCAAVPDINGPFLLAFNNAATTVTSYALTTVTLAQPVPGTTTVQLSIQPIMYVLGMPAVDVGMEIVDPAVTVNGACEFSAIATTANDMANPDSITIPAAANTLGSDILIALSPPLTLNASIKSSERFCGTIEGMATKPVPLPLAGTTFSAIRLANATTPLPKAEIACP